MASQHAQRPALTVLQLDTRFPRVPGDVGCPESYLSGVEIIRVPGASVGRIVRSRPDLIDIAPFERALQAAQGEVTATSCGFLSYWQGHLQAQSPRPIVASALMALERLSRDHAPEEVMILTFDAAALGALHMGVQTGFLGSIVGLPKGCLLRRVIEGDTVTLDVAQAQAEVLEVVKSALTPQTRTILLECTNLPPYAPAIRSATGCRVLSILTEIEAVRPGTVDPVWL